MTSNQSQRGRGTLEVEGRPPLLVRYRIDISQGPVLRSVTGHLAFEHDWTLASYLGPAVLVLEDGRRWECNVLSTNGELNNRGDSPPFP